MVDIVRLGSQVIYIKGAPHVVVKPAESLHRSSMVRDVVESGRLFVVNMNTGVLTIHTPVIREYLLEFTRKDSVKLPLDTEVALTRIKDYLASGNPIVRSFVISENGQDIFRTTLNTTQHEFLRQVAYAMAHV